MALSISKWRRVYLEKCASCHGVNLEAQLVWLDTMVGGMKLAPLHDKSGHTWHHLDEMLFNLTKYSCLGTRREE